MEWGCTVKNGGFTVKNGGFTVTNGGFTMKSNKHGGFTMKIGGIKNSGRKCGCVMKHGGFLEPKMVVSARTSGFHAIQMLLL